MNEGKSTLDIMLEAVRVNACYALLTSITTDCEMTGEPIEEVVHQHVNRLKVDLRKLIDDIGDNPEALELYGLKNELPKTDPIPEIDIEKPEASDEQPT